MGRFGLKKKGVMGKLSEVAAAWTCHEHKKRGENSVKTVCELDVYIDAFRSWFKSLPQRFKSLTKRFGDFFVARGGRMDFGRCSKKKGS